MDTKELLAKVRKIEIKTKILSQDLFAGTYHTNFKGKGMAFSEVREYQIGDEIRTIDWNVTARYNAPFVKTFEEERELTMMLLVDISGSGDFGAIEKTKRELITYLCSILSFSASQNQDKTGMILFTDEIEKTILPQKGRSNTLRIIRELVEYQPKSKKTDIKKALHYTMRIMKKKSILFIISDFLDAGFEKELEIISRKHDTIAFKVFNPLEKDIPKAGMVNFFDPETGENILLDTNSKKIREQYKQITEKKENELISLFKKNKIDYLEISTEEDYIKSLIGFFKRRK